jgi:uncharacterized membrane protein SpoIIM required for sporulation
MDKIKNGQNEFRRFNKSEKFVNERIDYWKDLHGIIIKINKSGYNKLTREETLAFPNLYRKICTDVELAKTLELSPDTYSYINTLLQHSHNILYSTPKRNLNDVVKYFSYEFPIAFYKNRISVFVIFILFFGIGLLTFFLILHNPKFALDVLPESLSRQMKEDYSKDVTNVRDIYSNIQMAGFYIKNNVSIAFYSFTLGVTFGIGTILAILSNAITIGGIAGVVVSSGYQQNFFNFVIAHSAFELLGICLAAGAGLSIGLSMIIATPEKRLVSINKKAKEVIPIVIVAALFFTIAAFIEGFISPTKISIYIKIFIAIFSLSFIIVYSYKYIIIKFFKKIKR